MGMGFRETFVSAAEDGTALTNTTSATSVIPAARKITLPAQFWDRPGKVLRIFAAGRISTAGAAPGTLTWDLRFGSVVAFNGGASGTLATSAANLTWRLWMELMLRTVGAGTGATVIGTGEFKSAALSAATPIMLLPASAPAAGNGFDSTVSQTVDLFATWSVASASNSLTCHQFQVDSDT